MNAVNHDAAARRFTTEVEGQRAVLDYSMSGNVMTITHTGVPPAISRRGIAAELMRAALNSARAAGWKVIPACSYAAAYLAKHPEYADLQHDRNSLQHESDLLDEALEESFPASDSPSVGRSS